jgi:tetratricopeptide (TPR) repeat protein
MTATHSPLDFPREKLGLCMIVKNEERALARCLESVRNWVGEIVIVDTGSTDGTVGIAESLGARVFHFPWCDDFSAARNAALDHVTSEWVLVLDGDETLFVDSPADFKAALQQTQWDGFSLPIRSLNDNGTYSKAMVFRLFRRERPGMRYRGEIHEQMEAVAAGVLRTSSLACLHLDHDGYTAAVVAGAGKALRNIHLSRKLTQSRPDDPFSWFVYAMSLAQSDINAMLDAAHRAMALIDANPERVRTEHYVVNLYLAAINAFRARGNFEQVVMLADRALVLFPASPDLLYQRGGARLAFGNFVGAADDFVAALGVAASSFQLVVDPAATGYGALTGLAQALRKLGRGDEATAQLQKAIAQAPAEFPSAHAEMGSLLMDSGAIERAAPFFEEAYRRSPNDGGVALKLGWCLYKLSRLGSAEVVLRGAAKEPQTDLLLARILLDTGRAEQALASLTANDLPAALLTVGWCQFVLRHYESAAREWDAWLVHAPDGNNAKVALLLFRQLIGDGPAQAAPSLLPEAPKELDSCILLLIKYQLTDCFDEIVRRGSAVLDGQWPTVRIRWAQALAMEGYIEAAMPLLFEAAQELPQNGAIYYWLGYCAVLRGQTEDAKVMFEECLRCEPGHPQAKQALGLL